MDTKELISFELAADELTSFNNGSVCEPWSLAFQFLSFHPVVLQDAVTLPLITANGNQTISLHCGLCCYFSINYDKLLQKLQLGALSIFLHYPNDTKNILAVALIPLNDDLNHKNTLMLAKTGSVQLRCVKTLKVMAEIRIGMRLCRLENKNTRIGPSIETLNVPAKLNHHAQSQTDVTNVQGVAVQTKHTKTTMQNTCIQTEDHVFIDKAVQVEHEDNPTETEPINVGDNHFEANDMLPLFGQFLKLSIGKSLKNYPILNRLTQEIEAATLEQDVKRESPLPTNICQNQSSTKIKKYSSQNKSTDHYIQPDDWKSVGKTHNAYSRIYLSKPYPYHKNRAFDKRLDFVRKDRKITQSNYHPPRNTIIRQNYDKPTLKDASTCYSMPQNIGVQTEKEFETKAIQAIFSSDDLKDCNGELVDANNIDKSKIRRKLGPSFQFITDPSSSRRHAQPSSEVTRSELIRTKKKPSLSHQETIYSEEFETDDDEEARTATSISTIMSPHTEQTSPEAKQISSEYNESESLIESKGTVVERRSSSSVHLPPLDRRSSSKQLVLSNYGYDLSEDPHAPLSPVSEYLNRLRAENEQNIIRSTSVRTDSVSSYQPSDIGGRLSRQ